MFYQTLLSPQVKRCAIITYKHGIYELPHELPNNLRLRTLGNKEISGERLKPMDRLQLHPPSLTYPTHPTHPTQPPAPNQPTHHAPPTQPK